MRTKFNSRTTLHRVPTDFAKQIHEINISHDFFYNCVPFFRNFLLTFNNLLQEKINKLFIEIGFDTKLHPNVKFLVFLPLSVNFP